MFKIFNFSKVPHRLRALIWEMLEALHREFEVGMLFDANWRIGDLFRRLSSLEAPSNIAIKTATSPIIFRLA